MISKQQVRSILLLLSLGAIFTTNLKATKNANGNAFIIGSIVPIISLVGEELYNMYNKSNDLNEDSLFLNKKTITSLLVLTSIYFSIGWLLKKYLTGQITKHVKNKHVQNIVMVGVGTIATIIFILLNSTIVKKTKNKKNNIEE